MKLLARRGPLIALLALVGLALSLSWDRAPASAAGPELLITGSVYDRQSQPVIGAQAELLADGATEPVSVADTQPDGRYALAVPQIEFNRLTVRIQRSHFQPTSIDLSSSSLDALRNGETVTLANTTLIRKINLAFWIATGLFVAVLVMIAADRLHNTLATMVGVAVIFGLSYLGRPISEDLFIFDFLSGLSYVDWNVIFLIMGMMIVIAVVERTGIFQWMAFQAYRLSGGRKWLLVSILMVLTGVASATLDNVTTMLLMTPITVRIALAMGFNPLALLMPEVMASNVAGISTLIGTPTNILIGSYADISFNAFLTNLTPGVLLAMLGLILYSQWAYKDALAPTGEGGISPVLLEELETQAEITQPDHLKKAGWVGAGMLILFVVGERFHLLPSVTALMGATALLVWIRPNIEEMIEAVDWTTLVFFMTLFIVVGAIQEVGLISLIADGIGRLVSDNLLLAVLMVTWASALLSGVIANIPFTAAMLPVVGFLSSTVPGAESNVLFFCLSVGSALGGNGTLIGASANMVTAGISERSGQPISYGYFFRKGFPAMLLTVALASAWLLIHFLVLGD